MYVDLVIRLAAKFDSSSFSIPLSPTPPGPPRLERAVRILLERNSCWETRIRGDLAVE